MKFAVLLLLFTIFLPNTEINPEFNFNEKRPQEKTQTEAFGVLTTKCNVCHAKKKRTDIFTLENMDSLAADINKQVFIKKKMPKGRKIKLTEKESEALQDWLSIVLN